MQERGRSPVDVDRGGHARAEYRSQIVCGQSRPAFHGQRPDDGAGATALRSPVFAFNGEQPDRAEALKAQAFERLRALIEAVVLTPEDGHLVIDLRVSLPRCCRYVPERKRKNLPPV